MKYQLRTSGIDTGEAAVDEDEDEEAVSKFGDWVGPTNMSFTDKNLDRCFRRSQTSQDN